MDKAKIKNWFTGRRIVWVCLAVPLYIVHFYVTFGTWLLIPCMWFYLSILADWSPIETYRNYKLDKIDLAKRRIEFSNWLVKQQNLRGDKQ